MAPIDLIGSCTGCSRVRSIELREAINQATVNAEIVCESHTLSIGDSVDVAMGTSLQSNTMITGGIVRKIIARTPEFDYQITVQDALCRSIDYAIVADDPQHPYEATNIKAEDLLVYLLGLAGITGVDAASTVFTFGTVQPVPINMVNVWTMIEMINRISGYTTYCDAAGTVHFVDRPAYITTGDTVSTHSYATGNSGDILTIEYDQNTEQLVNRVVVYGGVGNTVHATAEATSPYLPVDFFKTMVLAHPLVDNQASVDATAALNLEIFNRLTENLNLTVKGNSSVRVRDVVDVTEGFTEMAGDLWLVYSITHSLSKQGFEQKITLVR